MYTRNDYMNHNCTHRQYYGQFVNEQVKNAVIHMINVDPSKSIDILREKFAKDEHFNNIPMKKWDALGGFAFNFRGEMTMKPTNIEPVDYKLIKEAGEGVSASTMVCIYKEAARQLIEV